MKTNALIADSVIQTLPLDHLSETLRPDRREVMNPIGTGRQSELARDVVLECLVGSHNLARDLTTGIVKFAPGARLPAHTHPVSESITLLSGEAIVEVEGRSYTLHKLDNVVIPKGLVHSARNTSSYEQTLFHVALASGNPTRTVVDKISSQRGMPDDSTGLHGAERVNRFATARRFAAGPNAEFIDCFNCALMPGLEMSGGYGLFQPGGRLPAHIHNFDESICIVSGIATCVVEGREYSMADLSTALQPRGRVHYFINNSNTAMEMLWVYAGPMPERIIVDEVCATPAGNPWKD